MSQRVEVAPAYLDGHLYGNGIGDGGVSEGVGSWKLALGGGWNWKLIALRCVGVCVVLVVRRSSLVIGPSRCRSYACHCAGVRQLAITGLAYGLFPV